MSSLSLLPLLTATIIKIESKRSHNEVVSQRVSAYNHRSGLVLKGSAKLLTDPLVKIGIEPDELRLVLGPAKLDHITAPNLYLLLAVKYQRARFAFIAELYGDFAFR